MKNKILKTTFYILLTSCFVINTIRIFAQGQTTYQLKTITTAVPFLLFNPDAVSMGKGGLGVTSTSIYSEIALNHNPALLANGRKYLSGFLSYVPFNYNAVPDQNYSHLGILWGIAPKHAVAMEFTYFSQGAITFTDNTGTNIGQYKPKEFIFSAKYGVSVGRTINLGLGLKYINSNLTGGYSVGGTGSVGKSFAADIGFNYRDTVQIYSSGKLQWNLGMAIQNIGNKISYKNTKLQGEFLPQNLKLGFMVTLRQKVGTKSYFAFDLGYEINKLLVPSPPIYATDAYGNILEDPQGNKIIAKGKNPNVDIMTAMVQSFYDAPNGSKEEWQEVNHLLGFETRQVFSNQFYWAIRSGYFYESANKGGRQFATFGLGGGFWGFSLNGYYLVPSNSISRLPNLFGFQLGYTCNLSAKRKFFRE